jgi:hypothetical protein
VLTSSDYGGLSLKYVAVFKGMYSFTFCYLLILVFISYCRAKVWNIKIPNK